MLASLKKIISMIQSLRSLDGYPKDKVSVRSMPRTSAKRRKDDSIVRIVPVYDKADSITGIYHSSGRIAMRWSKAGLDIKYSFHIILRNNGPVDSMTVK